MEHPTFIDPADVVDLPEIAETERAWAAGFFDGEGCCGVYESGPKKLRTRVQMSICQNETTTLRRLYEAVGLVGSLHWTPARAKCPNPRYDLMFTAASDIARVTCLLWPYLTEPKRRQIQRCYVTRAANLDRPRELAHPGQKLTNAQVAEILALLAKGDRKQAEIAAEFGVGQQTVSRINLGRWKGLAGRARTGRKPTFPAEWPAVAGQSAIPEFIDQMVAKAAGASSTERAWAAGFFDAEGCSTPHSGRYLKLYISQTNTETLERFSAVMGNVGRISQRAESRPANWSPQWCYVITKAADYLRAVSLLWEFLGEPKRQQIIKTHLRREAAINGVDHPTDCGG